MFKIAKKISILLFAGIFLFSPADANWITKKSDKSKETIKKEKKEKSEWIKLKKLKDKIKKKEVKKNKEEFKKEEKKITKEVKSWITKKSKDSHINSIDKLPVSEIYFTGASNESDRPFYGYINADINSKKINDRYETSKGMVYFNDGKTTCKIGTTVLDVTLGPVIARISGKCSDGISFHGSFTETKKNAAYGTAATNKGENFIFTFDYDKKLIANLFKNQKEGKSFVRSIPSAPNTPIELNPTGKYYALLIGNSKYIHWPSLKSPVNDINQIGQILKKNYNFSKVITVPNANREQIFNALINLKKITTDKDYVLIYYTGHGDYVKTVAKTESYWIPVNGKKEMDFNWINVSDVENYFQDIEAHHLLVMVDSCYFPNLTKGGNKTNKNPKEAHYNKIFNKRSRVIVTAGLHEEVIDTAGKNSISIFAKTFIRELNNNKNIIPITKIYNQIKEAHTDFDQSPTKREFQDWGDQGGEFLFVKK